MRELVVVLTAVLCLSLVASAETPVHFADPVLKQAVEETLEWADPTPWDMLALTNLTCASGGVTSLAGLEYATNLRYLSVMENQIADLSPLAGLTSLQFLNIQDNQITDISPLTGLIHLERLGMEDVFVTDLAPLLNLGSLTWLDVRDDPLQEDAYQVQIPQIIANNPGIEVLHNRAEIHLTLTAGPGGSIVSPGEGDFTFQGRTELVVEARPDPGFVFAAFSGTVSGGQNPMSFALQYDSNIRASFTSVLHVIHVDDDAPADPGPGDPAVSDPLENGTRGHPFDRVQDAIEVADKGATIFVHAGTYRETIDLPGKQIELTGFDPNDPPTAAWPVLDGAGRGPVVSCTGGEDANCVLTGLVVTGGQGRFAGAIRCAGSSPTIANCIIRDNRATESNGAAIYCTDSSAALVNCTIVDNRGGSSGAALSSTNSRVSVVNSILWGNEPREVLSQGGEAPAVRYSIVAGGWPGPGNLSLDPLFATLSRWVSPVDPAVAVSPDDVGAVWLAGDYHLQSQAGRWDVKAGEWKQDQATSPGIDSGDPAVPVGPEPPPNGGIINLGAYGGTPEAGKSLAVVGAP